jgi:hypothetical protein
MKRMERKKLSEATKRKISMARKGKKLSLEWREKLKAAQLEANAKPVVCVDTEEDFESVSHAARELRVKPIQISRVCHGKRYTVHGLTFRFKEEE